MSSLPRQAGLNRPEIKRGSKSKYVIELKVLLNGILSLQGKEMLSVNSVFGDRTFNLLKRFEREHHLKPNGICGDPTWEKLLKVASPELRDRARQARENAIGKGKAHAINNQTQKPTDGVTNPLPIKIPEAFRQIIAGDQEATKKAITRAINALEALMSLRKKKSYDMSQYLNESKTDGVFHSTFVGVGLSPVTDSAILSVESNLKKMRSVIDSGIPLYFHEGIAKTTKDTKTKKGAIAYQGAHKVKIGNKTLHEKYIAFTILHINEIDKVTRVDTFAHEVAHAAIDAGHSYEGTKLIDSADRLGAFVASFAE